LTQDMTVLTQTEARIKADSGNVNHQGIDISASHDAYMDFSTQKGTLADTVKEAKLRTAAQTVAADVGQVIASGQLSKAEVTKLQNVMAEIVGDAESAAEYISINLHDGGAMGTEIGATAQTYVDSGNGVGDNGRERADREKVISEIKYKPSSGAELKASPGKTTTVLGNYKQDMQYIIDELGNVKSTDFGPNDGGFNVLNVPDEKYVGMTREHFWEKHNRPWLDNAIDRGDDIVLATKPEGRVMKSFNKTTGEWEPSGFAREYQYLIDNGYHYDSVANIMVK